MRNKILLLSILGLALARPPNPVDSTSSNFGEKEKQRISRSIWPFTSSETTTEGPVDYPPSLPDNNNEWFIRGETPLPQGIDLNKYPVWKVHKYNGIDLHPVKLQPENTYPPELQDSGYSSGSSSSSDFSQNGYQDSSRGYPDAYPSQPGTYPAAEQENYRTGEFKSSSFTPGLNPFKIQTQHTYEIHATPQAPQRAQNVQYPQASYGPPDIYRGYNQEVQKQAFGEEKSQTSNGKTPDLSFLDDLGGLAPFLPDPTSNDENTEIEQEEEIETPQPGFFERILSPFRGSTTKVDTPVTVNEQLTNSVGFLSSVFGLGSNSQPTEKESTPTESSGNAFSSLFYQTETEKPAVVIPTTYYLPKTRGSYVAVKLPSNAAPSFTPNIRPYDDVSSIAFHQAPRVPFTQNEIPAISSPTLDSAYPYNLAYSEIRNSGNAGSVVSSDYQSSIVHGQPRPPTTKIAPHFTQTYRGYYQQSDVGADGAVSYQGDALDVPNVGYTYQSDNDKEIHSPTSLNANQFDQIQNQFPNTQSENFDTTSSNLSDVQGETLPHGLIVDENEPISGPQSSGGFIPSLGYGPPIEADDQQNFDANNQENSQHTSGYDHHLDNTDNQNFDISSVLSPNFLPPKETDSIEGSVPVYHVYQYSVSQNPSDTQGPNDYTNLPVNQASDFYGKSSDSQNDLDNRFVQNLSTLTSYGLPSNSYRSNTIVPASSNIRNIVVPPPMKDEVSDVVSIDMNKDVFRSTVPEQLPTKKVDRVVRKVMKRRNFLGSNNSRRSVPQRQAPTEETDTSLIIRSEKDSIPEVRGSRQYDGTHEVNDGYSKIQHQVVSDTTGTVKLLNPVPEAIQ